MTKRKIFIAATLTSLLFFIGTTAQAQNWVARFYEKNPVSVTKLKANWGEPLNIVDEGNGVKKMVFGPKLAYNVGYTYFLVKDEKVIDRGTTDSLDKKE